MEWSPTYIPSCPAESPTVGMPSLGGGSRASYLACTLLIGSPCDSKWSTPGLNPAGGLAPRATNGLVSLACS